MDSRKKTLLVEASLTKNQSLPPVHLSDQYLHTMCIKFYKYKKQNGERPKRRPAVTKER